MDMFTQWCPPQKKRKEEKGMVTSQGGMSEALVPLSRWPPKGAGSKKPPSPPHSPPPTKRTRGDVPGGSRFGNALF